MSGVDGLGIRECSNGEVRVQDIIITKKFGRVQATVSATSLAYALCIITSPKYEVFFTSD
jgi:hypothetical protein